MAAPAGNKFAIGNNGGRPPVYKSYKTLVKRIDEYFDYIKGDYQEVKKGRKVISVCMREPEPATITGLSLFLGFGSRSSLDDYEKKEVFSFIIKKARTMVEYEYEKRLMTEKATGPIFALKNMGWKDRSYNSIDLDFEKMSDEDLDKVVNLVLHKSVNK